MAWMMSHDNGSAAKRGPSTASRAAQTPREEKTARDSAPFLRQGKQDDDATSHRHIVICQ